jgi:hypothetical protein
MHLGAEDLRKHREINFREPHPDERQAYSAAQILLDVEGVLEAEPLSVTGLRVLYDIRHVTLRDIEDALTEIGFHLDNSLFHKLRRTLWYYSDDTHRANIGCEQGRSNCTRRIFVNRYSQLEHGCRDERPQHWRRYL